MAWYNRTLTAGDLMKIDQGRIERSNGLKVTMIGIQNLVKKESWIEKVFKLFKRGPKYLFYKVVRYKVISDSGNTYNVIIKLSPGANNQKLMNNKIQVYCSCADFMYRAAYGLNSTDNLVRSKSIDISLGEALTTKPVRVSPTPVCKHIYACLIDLSKNLKKYGLQLS